MRDVTTFIVYIFEILEFLKSIFVDFSLWNDDPEDSFPEDLRYFRGFIQLQNLIDTGIIRLQTGCEEVPSYDTQQFPYPCYTPDL